MKFRKRNIILYLASQIISLLGSSLVQCVTFWYITLETQSGTIMTIAMIAGVLPTFLVSPFAGVWADRHDRRTIIMLSDGLVALATLALFYAVGRWNGFSDELMYVKNEKLFPIQLLLYNILQNTTSIEIGTQEGFFDPGVGETMKMATVMFATVPILLIYPWLQRYFVTGVTIGAVKG